MKSQLPYFDAATVSFNPAIDRTITIPGLTIGAVNRGEEVSSQPAGKGVNVASALADYGLGVAVTGFLGSDNTAPFEELFLRKKIEDCFVAHFRPDAHRDQNHRFCNTPKRPILIFQALPSACRS